jgi:ABC-type transport system substrate-binding protein
MNRSTIFRRLLWMSGALALLLLALPTSGHADRRNNTVTIGFVGELTTLDPARGFSGADYSVLYSLYDRLIHFDPQTMEPIPGLATEWRFTGPDNRHFEMVLRRGVTFHDGTPLDAAAVRASLMHFKAMRRLNDLDVVEDIEVLAPDRLVLKLQYEYSVLPAVLTDRAGMIVSPTALARHGDDYPRNPVGSGPFMLRRWVQGTQIELVRFPGYWNPERIRLSGITYRFFLNPTSATSAILSGQIDHVWNVDPKNLPVLRANPRLRVEREPSAGFLYMAVRHDTPLMDNRLVRQAISMSMDRRAIGDALFGTGNSGSPALMLATPSNFAYSPDLENSVRYNPIEARRLLAEAGHPNGITLRVCGGTNVGTGSDITDILSEQMRPAGIRLDVTIMAGSACLQRFNTTRDFHIWQGSFSGRPDPFITYSQTFMSTGQFNRGRKDFGVDELINRIARVYSREEQIPIYREINARWIEEVPAIQILYNSNFAVYNREVAGERPNQQGKPDLTTLYWR